MRQYQCAKSYEVSFAQLQEFDGDWPWCCGGDEMGFSCSLGGTGGSNCGTGSFTPSRSGGSAVSNCFFGSAVIRSGFVLPYSGPWCCGWHCQPMRTPSTRAPIAPRHAQSGIRLSTGLELDGCWHAVAYDEVVAGSDDELAEHWVQALAPEG